MKKPYTKPDVVYESFTLCTSIANCEIKVDGMNQGNCGYAYSGGIIFTQEVVGCQPQNGGTVMFDSANNGLCYHVPIESRNLFNS